TCADLVNIIQGLDDVTTTHCRCPTDLARLRSGEVVCLTNDRGSFYNDPFVVVLELVPHNGAAGVQRYITGHGELDVVVRVREVLINQLRQSPACSARGALNDDVERRPGGVEHAPPSAPVVRPRRTRG